MKKYFNILCCILLIFAVCCSCGKSNAASVPRYNLPSKLSAAKSGILAENENFRLDWNYDLKSLTLTDFRTGNIWSSVPQEILEDNEDYQSVAASGVSASIEISYVEPVRSLIMETDSEELLRNGGFIYAKRIENGIRLIYYFNNEQISIPVEYVLDNEGLKVSLIPSGITEGENKLYSVSIMPFFISAPNNTDSYIFVPSGSGAVMYTDDTERQVRRYSEPVFGQDETFQTVFKNKQTESIRLPVFGVKNGVKAMIGVLEEGGESAYIEASAGDSSIGYSFAYAEFLVRGYADAYVKDVDGNNSEVKKYTDSIANTDRMTVRYIPVAEENANYSDMAETYREYLNLDKISENSPALMLSFYGGAEVRKLFLGIPYRTVVSVTDFSDVKNILNDLQKETGVNILANLKGFGNSGLDYGELGGGFKFSGKFGGKKDFNTLNEWCEQQNIILSADIDLVYFNNSGNGYSATFDTAKTANTVTARKYYYSTVTHEQNGDNPSTYLLKRGLNEKLTDSISAMIDTYSLRAVTLSTLSNTAYSDYESADYYNKGNMASDASEIIEAVKKDKTVFVADNANSYAAVKADYILNSPTSSSLYNDLDSDIPFYQMVFHGSIPLSSRAINLADESRNEFLKAVSTGSSLYFTLCEETGNDFIVGVHDALAVSEYSALKSMILEYTKEAEALIEKVSDSYIVSYSKNGEVSCTEFSNGTVVYVNFGNFDAESELGIIPAQSFIYK